MTKKILLSLICILTFAFANAQLTSVAIVGDGAGGWPTGGTDNYQMTSTDGENWTITNLPLTVGSVKFRGNNSWDLPYNWGGTSFPAGTAIVDGAGITSVAGFYNVTFNSTTLAYNFELQQSTFQIISIIGDATPGTWNTDTDMNTTDGTLYTINNVYLAPGALKFRGDHAWTLPYNWGGTEFPSGTSIIDGAAITIPSAGIYTISFNKTFLTYSFTFKTISIIGDATPGAWDTDTDMTTTDGINYTINDVALVAGALKFRGNHSWTLPYNWGGTEFPSGTAIVDGAGITIPTAGDYTISFNSDTGDYTFTNTLGLKEFDSSTFKAYPNPTQNNWTFIASNETIESIQIVDITGKLICTVTPKSNKATIDAFDLISGIYFAKVATATVTNNLKLVKK